MEQQYEKLIKYITEYQDDMYRHAYMRVHDQEAALAIVKQVIERALHDYKGVGKNCSLDTYFQKAIQEASREKQNHKGVAKRNVILAFKKAGAV